MASRSALVIGVTTLAWAIATSASCMVDVFGAIGNLPVVGWTNYYYSISIIKNQYGDAPWLLRKINSLR